MLNGTQLRCLKKDEADEVMREIHAGVCGSHMNGIILSKKIVRQGYYWMSMEKDCIKTVRQVSSVLDTWEFQSSPAYRVEQFVIFVAFYSMRNRYNRRDKAECFEWA